jgi:hypothetical protein
MGFAYQVIGSKQNNKTSGEIMDSNAVYIRTPAGSLAISNPDAHMPQRMRSLLVMIDGRTPVSRICELLPGLAHMPGIFSALESMGFIRRAQARATLEAA